MKDRRPFERETPVGEPAVRADPEVAGERAREAVGFDPDNPQSVAEAADTVSDFAAGEIGTDDDLIMLRGAAACAALVRGTGSYKTAAKRAGETISVSFIRKWARVHDLPQSIRRHVARGTIPPTAAKHIARVAGEARFLIAWSVLDAGLTVRDVRSIASSVNNGESVESALRGQGVDLGQIELSLSAEEYVALRREASMGNVSPGVVADEAIGRYLSVD